MSKKVLIVDDSATIRQQLNFTLVKDGFIVVEAEDGVQGLAMVASNSDIALIISDVNMPNMNGIDFIKNLKDKGISIPVVMLTTEGAADLIEKAKGYGAKGWMVKPFKPEQIIAVAKKLAA
jgi:two-component system chemotaxis response regulator CheY